MDEEDERGLRETPWASARPAAHHRAGDNRGGGGLGSLFIHIHDAFYSTTEMISERSPSVPEKSAYEKVNASRMPSSLSRWLSFGVLVWLRE